MKKLLLILSMGSAVLLAQPSVAQAEIKAHIHINPLAWILPAPRVRVIQQPVYRYKHYHRPKRIIVKQYPVVYKKKKHYKRAKYKYKAPYKYKRKYSQNRYLGRRK